jgi:predicted Zn-dependent peptidase
MALQVRQHQLSNGLTVLAEVNPDALSFAAGFFVRAGSRDEPIELHGVSHFLEHMMFKGPEGTDAIRMNRVFDELGARYNAYTTHEMTGYYAQVIPQFTTRIIDQLVGLMRPALRPDDFETEKGVILEEIRMYNDEPPQRVFELAMQRCYEPHPIARPIIGTEDSIRSMTRDAMAGYFARAYTPANSVCVLAGAMDLDRVLEQLESRCAAWQAGHWRRDATVPVARSLRASVSQPGLTRAYVVGISPAPSATSPDRYAARVLADVIGDSEGSRLYWSLIETALSDEADFSFYPHDGAGSFLLSLTCDPLRVERVCELAISELRRLAGDLTDAEVTRAKNKLLTSITLGGESPLGRVNAIGGEWLYSGGYHSMDDEVRHLASVDRDAVARVIARFGFEPMTLISLVPEESR